MSAAAVSVKREAPFFSGNRGLPIGIQQVGTVVEKLQNSRASSRWRECHWRDPALAVFTNVAQNNAHGPDLSVNVFHERTVKLPDASVQSVPRADKCPIKFRAARLLLVGDPTPICVQGKHPCAAAAGRSTLWRVPSSFGKIPDQADAHRSFPAECPGRLKPPFGGP